MEQLCKGLLEIRKTCADEAWDREIKPACLSHPLREMVHQDPYTYRAYAKPRGYAGDAVMIDYIYAGRPPVGTTVLGEKIFSYTTGCSNGQSVRARRDRIAALIDEVAGLQRKPRILSVACGHLREVERCTALWDGQVEEFIALDQDAETLGVVERDYGKIGVRPIRMTIRELLRNGFRRVGFDLVYATGLYDYLPDPIAERLTKNLFALLAPGGRLLLANFLPDSMGRGYMEAFMDWRLVYRNLHRIGTLALNLPAGAVARQIVSQDEWGNIGYLEVRKA
jgi:SAM-dependent methyltransferase